MQKGWRRQLRWKRRPPQPETRDQQQQHQTSLLHSSSTILKVSRALDSTPAWLALWTSIMVHMVWKHYMFGVPILWPWMIFIFGVTLRVLKII